MEKLHIKEKPAVEAWSSYLENYNQNRLRNMVAMEDRVRGWLKTASTSKVVKRIREKARRKSRRSMEGLARSNDIPSALYDEF